MKLRLSRKNLCIPYAMFLVLFVIAPIFIMLYYAFTDVDGKFTFSNFALIFSDVTVLSAALASVSIALITTLLCLLIGYPVAYILARSGLKHERTLLLLFILPMWINFVLRMNALKEFLHIINILDKSPYVNTVIGMVYDFLPFMILPIYSVLVKIDDSLTEAAQDLGANWFRVFTKVTFPLSIPGIISGFTMVFLPAVTTFYISNIFGGGKVILIGNVIQERFLVADDWNFGSAMSIVMMVLVFISMKIMNLFEKRGINPSAR